MSASYGIEKANLVVWLDSSPALDPALAGSLCRRHADALIVPKGWRIDDRRESIPRLFHAPDTSVEGVGSRTSVDLAVIEETPGGGIRRRVHKSSRDDSNQASLFDAVATEASSPSVTTEAPSIVAATTHINEGNEGDEHDERVEQVEHISELNGGNDIEGVDELEETRAIPWMPRLVSRATQTDADSDGEAGADEVTDATPAQGRLLRRAFGDRNVR